MVLAVFLAPPPTLALPLSPGDRLRVLIPEGEEFSGTYEVNLDGTINFPYLEPLQVSGFEPSAVQQIIGQSLLQNQLFQPEFLRVGVTILQWAPVEVTVSGAVFQPGRVLINTRSSEELDQNADQTSGDYPPQRYLTAALQSAGGIQPDADIRQIQIIRGDQVQEIDLSGILTGTPVNDFPLVAGDQIIVPATNQIDPTLVRPSQITPPGIQVFLSNLSDPVSSNSSAGINADTARMPYGTRLSQAVVAANCVGGTQATNANRKVLLVTTDRRTGQPRSLERSVEDLVHDPGTVETNPFLMPGDGVACYDSTVTNIRDVARTLGDIFTPFRFLLDLFF